MDTPPVLPPPLPANPARPAAPSHGLKLFAIGGLIVVLWVALQLIDGVRRERLGFREQAEAEIAHTWGGEQLLAGPVLAVPYTYVSKTSREVANERGVPVRLEEARQLKACAYFLPAELTVRGQLEPSLRKRGIFTVPVYEARLTIGGHFKPDAAALGVDGAAIDWSAARLLLALRHPRGLRSAPAVQCGDLRLTLEPGAPRDGWCETLEAPLKLAGAPGGDGLPFTCELLLQGSRLIELAPVGAENRIELKSSWPDPSFGGGALPVRRTVGPAGFEAAWAQSYFGRGYPQQWSDAQGRTPVAFAAIAASAVNVALLQPVDAYRLVERAIKYGLLFLVLVFATFFVFEVSARLRVHPLQYLLVGAALILFFLGYLALSEFVAAGLAYGIAAAASTLLVAGYSASVLRTGMRSLVVGAGLGATYGYLYFILQLQDYALLAGAAALFALLGLAMWVTRRIDWYGSEAGNGSVRSAG